jgi:hypothetical protein
MGRDLGELQPVAVGGQSDEQKEGEGAGWATVIIEVGHALIGPRIASVDEVLEPTPRVERDERLLQAGLDVLTLAAALAFE